VVTPEALLPTCRQLARDIADTEPVTRREIKRLIDAGWYSTLEDGLRRELEASQAHSRNEVRPEKVAARRAAIQSRGRQQSGNP
jgi:enoyl-CoA hydratase